MEAITQLVVDSLARHGFDRPVDPRRLQWSRWSRCDTPHSLLVVPSKPGIFALAEEVMDLGSTTGHGGTDAFVRPPVGTAAPGCPAEQSSAAVSSTTNLEVCIDREGHDFSSEPALSERSASKGAITSARYSPALAAGAPSAAEPRRMLAVLQFSEDDDMAFTLDRMFTRINPMRERLASGKCFLRFVVIEDGSQRRTICAALNQWMATSAEKSTGLPSDFSTSLEMTTDRGATDALVRPVPATDRVGRTLLSDSAETLTKPAKAPPPKANISAALNSGAAKNLHCPHPLPSGF